MENREVGCSLLQTGKKNSKKTKQRKTRKHSSGMRTNRLKTGHASVSVQWPPPDITPGEGGSPNEQV